MKVLKKLISLLLINGLIFTSVVFLITVKEAKDVFKNDEIRAKKEMEYILSRDSWDTFDDMGSPAGLYCDKQPYINGEINQEYVNELIATYVDFSSVHPNGALYVMAEDDQGMEAKPENKIYFTCYPADDGPRYYRILDFDKFFSEDELSDMKSFFGGVNVELNIIQCMGEMDDKYIYPRYIGLGHINSVVYNMDQEDIEQLVITNDNYTGPSNKKYKLALYKIDKEYEYENRDALVDVTSYYGDSAIDGINLVNVSGQSNILHDWEYREYIEDGRKLYNQAAKNIDKYKNQLDENGIYEDDSIFKYEKIFSRQREVDGHTITEYVSYISMPFKSAIESCKENGDYKNIILLLVILNVAVYVIFRIWMKKKNAYEEKARELFYNVTDKLTESVDNIKKINCEIVSGEDKSQRSVLDREIKNLVGYIRDVLEWSKVDAGVLEIYPEEIEFSYMVEAVIKDVNKDSKMNIVTDMDMDVILDGDLSRIAKAVAAFIKDIMSKTDVSEKVYVQVRQNNGNVYFKVTNNENLNKSEHKRKKELQSKFDVLLGISYVNLHNGKYWYYNEAGQVMHIFEIPIKYEQENIDKKDSKIKDIYGVIAHEIKTPLNVIKLYNEALMEGDTSADKEKKYNSVIETQLDIITNQIHELIATKHLKTGKLKGEKEKVDIALLVNDIVKKYSVLMEDKQLKVRVDGADSIEVFVDYTGARSIISNYIINAIKYSDVGSTVDISLDKDDKFVIIKIANEIPQNLRYNTDDKERGVVNCIERDGLGLIIARTYIDICKAKYGCNENDETIEYWLKFRLN